MKQDILSLTPEELNTAVLALGVPRFRADQIRSWLAKGVRDFDAMTNLPASLIAQLKERYALWRPRVLDKKVSTDGTVKYLWELADGNAVETVIMRYRYGNTVCVSSQVGCRQGCAFCASTIGGLVRDLTASEILDEVVFSQEESGLPISNIVLMGIGEPLDNFDNVTRFLRLVNDPAGMNIGMRHITLSTCGLCERFEDLAALGLPITLTVSLHAPDDETRSKLMPANRTRGIDRLMESCADYAQQTGRRITFEYAMIRGVNDSDAQAEQLAKLARKVHAHVNLIPLNHVSERDLFPSEPAVIDRFEKILLDRGVNVTVRRRLGNDVDASCGQLRRKYNKTRKVETPDT